MGGLFRFLLLFYEVSSLVLPGLETQEQQTAHSGNSNNNSKPENNKQGAFNLLASLHGMEVRVRWGHHPLVYPDLSLVKLKASASMTLLSTQQETLVDQLLANVLLLHLLQLIGEVETFTMKGQKMGQFMRFTA